MKCLYLKAALAQLPELLVAVDKGSREAGLPEALARKAQIVLEELFVNVITHAYGGDFGPVEICLEPGEGVLRLRIIDWGPPFNPLEAKSPDMQGRIADNIAGGAGLLLVKAMSRELSYARQDDQNVICFSVSLT